MMSGRLLGIGDVVWISNCEAIEWIKKNNRMTPQGTMTADWQDYFPQYEIFGCWMKG
jgi:hypothetical protein